jgi:hypothetical protein
VLTLNEEPKVGHPHASCERYGELVPVPNSNASGAHQLFLPRTYRCIVRNSCEYVHAKHDQEGCSGKGHVPRELKKNMRRQSTDKRSFSQTGRVGRHAHKLDDALNLGIITCQGVDAHMTDSSHDIPDS